MTYISPTVYATKFTCPRCGAIAHMKWADEHVSLGGRVGSRDGNLIRTAKCGHCDEYTVWVRDVMVDPDRGTAPLPNPSMPEAVKSIYSEAASIASKSPRGSAALLRLGVQVLCRELGQPGKSINDDIAALVANGLPRQVQQSLDIVRVTGNNAVHPGQLDVDDPEVVSNLFGLLNIIVEYMISLPSRVDAMYGNLPKPARDGIKQRDSS